MRRSTKKSSGPEMIEGILGRWLRDNRPARAALGELGRTWRDIVGEEIAAHSRITEYRSGVLRVEVDSAPLLHELATYHSREVIESLRATEAFRNLSELKFRSGTF